MASRCWANSASFTPALAKQYDLRDAVWLAELNLDLLLARRNPAKSFKPLPQFPAIRRDVAMLVPEATTHDAVLQMVKQAKPANLETIELFDVFRGKNVPQGQKSMAYAFTYRSPEKTLTDAEVNVAHAKTRGAVQTQLRRDGPRMSCRRACEGMVSSGWLVRVLTNAATGFPRQ